MSYLTGGVNVVDALLFGGPSHETREAIAREHHQFIQNVDPSWGGQLIQRTKELYDRYNGAHVIGMVQNALNNVASISRPDMVFEFKEISDFQTAQPVMQAYLMANPVARKLYHANQCDGYSDTYIDPAPGIIGFGHDPYAHVMNGVIQLPAANDETGDLHFTNFSSAWQTADSEMLNIHQKASVINSWAVLERLFEEGDRDPTSPWGAGL